MITDCQKIWRSLTEKDCFALNTQRKQTIEKLCQRRLQRQELNQSSTSLMARFLARPSNGKRFCCTFQSRQVLALSNITSHASKECLHTKFANAQCEIKPTNKHLQDRHKFFAMLFQLHTMQDYYRSLPDVTRNVSSFWTTIYNLSGCCCIFRA